MRTLFAFCILALFGGCTTEEFTPLPAEEIPLAIIYPNASVSVDYSGSAKELLLYISNQAEISIEFGDFEDFKTELKLPDTSWQGLFDVILHENGYEYIEGKKNILITSTRSLKQASYTQFAIEVTQADLAELRNDMLGLVIKHEHGNIEIDQKRSALIYTLKPLDIPGVVQVHHRLDGDPTSRATQ